MLFLLLICQVVSATYSGELQEAAIRMATAVKMELNGVSDRNIEGTLQAVVNQLQTGSYMQLQGILGPHGRLLRQGDSYCIVNWLRRALRHHRQSPVVSFA